MSNAKDETISRRNLLKLGASLAISAASTGGASALANETRKATWSSMAARGARLPNQPNIIVIMTDQERHHMHVILVLGASDGSDSNSGIGCVTVPLRVLK